MTQWYNGKVFFTRLAQIVVGITFLFSGIVKGIDPMGTAIKIGEYAGVVSISLPNNLALIVSFLLITLEFVLGVALIIGYRPQISRWILLVLMAFMTIVTLYIYLFEPVADCGCFGDALVISNATTFYKNIVLLCLSSALFFCADCWYHWLPVAYADKAVAISVVVISGFNATNIHQLPVIDFRPYKIGSDLMELTQSGGTEGEYDYRFVYSKDGHEQIFTLDQLQEVDSTWVFVRDETIEITKAEQPLGSDFVLVRDDGTNAVESIAYEGQNTLLLISPNIREVSPKRLTKILDSGLPFSLAMGNSDEIWANEEYQSLEHRFVEVYQLDNTTAKTVIRSNPGLVVISGGKIVNKISGDVLTNLVKNPDFLSDPYQYQDHRDEVFRYVITFGWHVLLALSIVIAGIYYRIENRNNKIRKE